MLAVSVFSNPCLDPLILSKLLLEDGRPKVALFGVNHEWVVLLEQSISWGHTSDPVWNSEEYILRHQFASVHKGHMHCFEQFQVSSGNFFPPLVRFPLKATIVGHHLIYSVTAVHGIVVFCHNKQLFFFFTGTLLVSVSVEWWLGSSLPFCRARQWSTWTFCCWYSKFSRQHPVSVISIVQESSCDLSEMSLYNWFCGSAKIQ